MKENIKGGLPGLAGMDHIGFTVPNIEDATRFFVDIIGCELAFEIGPFKADDHWMSQQLGVHPRAVIRSLRMLRCKNGANFEIFEYHVECASRVPPKNSDVGGHHLALYVDDIGAAVDYLKGRGIEVQGDIVKMESGPSAGMTWVYFLSPWGMQLELVSYPEGMAISKRAASALWTPKNA